MTDYINRADAIEAIPCGLCYDKSNCVKAIEALPSADAVHGEWLHNAFYSGNEYKCSVCGETFKFLMGANFCPNCGARMYKGGDDK